MLDFKIRVDGMDSISYRMHETATKGETWLANEIMKDTRPYVPALTLSLSNRTHVEGNKAIYPGPYARYLYFGKVMEGPKYGPKHATDKDLVYTKTVNPQAQSHWFEASKAQNMKKWERGVKKYVRDEI